VNSERSFAQAVKSTTVWKNTHWT